MVFPIARQAEMLAGQMRAIEPCHPVKPLPAQVSRLPDALTLKNLLIEINQPPGIFRNSFLQPAHFFPRTMSPNGLQKPDVMRMLNEKLPHSIRI